MHSIYAQYTYMHSIHTHTRQGETLEFGNMLEIFTFSYLYEDMEMESLLWK